jgi:hypothetical protein
VRELAKAEELRFGEGCNVIGSRAVKDRALARWSGGGPGQATVRSGGLHIMSAKGTVARQNIRDTDDHASKSSFETADDDYMRSTPDTRPVQSYLRSTNSSLPFSR